MRKQGLAEHYVGLKGEGWLKGQRKTVAIARGMVLAPTLLLLDEAFEGLAPVVVKRFRDNAARIADRLYAIDRGEIIFEGKPQQALEDENVMRALRG